MWRRKQYQYLPYDSDDNDYFGCQKIVKAEWHYIHKRRANQSQPEPAATAALPDKLTGIALSGGGIRSASFCLGVLQALAYAGWLKKIDYLSTVSGGGYIGGSLSWLLHRKWKGPHNEKIPYGLDRDNFPYGSYPMVGMADKTDTGQAAEWNVYKGRMLRHLRQHARYLTPGNGINIMSLLAVMLRNTLFSLLIYGGLLVLLFALIGPLLFLPIDSGWGYGWLSNHLPWLPADVNRAKGVALMLGMGFVLFSGIYVLLTFLLPNAYSTGYNLRFSYDRWMGRLLTLALVLVTIGIVPNVYHWIDAAGHSKPKISTIQFSAKDDRSEIAVSGKFKPVDATNAADKALNFSGKSGALSFTGTLAPTAPQTSNQPSAWRLSALTDNMAALVGGLSTLLSTIASIWAFVQEGKPKKKIPSSVLVAVASVTLIFGLLLLAYYFAILLRVHSGWSIESAPWMSRAEPFATLLQNTGWLPWFAALFLIFTVFANLNYLSIHRYYRDRLMETFMPDLPDAIDVDGPLPGAPKSADSTALYELLREVGEPGQLGPYPIINTNIVLVSSKIPKFRARGGDNFILTPKFCGSNATGWCETKHSPYDDMTSPTAVAISGAAVHSNAGSGGEGATRSPWLSFLMGFFNIRLGYWASNPTPDGVRLQRIASALKRPLKMQLLQKGQSNLVYILRLLGHGLFVIVRWPLNQFILLVQYLLSLLVHAGANRPSAFYPGLLELYLRKNLNENSRLVQLSDGGHFENLGLYELIRRRLKLIIVCDGTADAKYAFDDLANAMEKIRADFGALIDFDCKDVAKLTPNAPGGSGDKAATQVRFAQQGYLIGKITYFNREQGTLIYLTTTLFEALTADIYAYRKTHEEFPDQPTADQFFDEKQFEAYRELGYQTAYHMMCDDNIKSAPDVQQTLGDPDISCSH